MTSGTFTIMVGRRPVFLQTQLLSHSGELTTTAPGPAARPGAVLEVMSQLLGDVNAELSQLAMTVFAPVSETPLADVKLTLSTPPASQVISAEPEVTKFLLLQDVFPLAPWMQACGGGPAEAEESRSW